MKYKLGIVIVNFWEVIMTVTDYCDMFCNVGLLKSSHLSYY